jgi:hypothetical protein
MEADALVEDDTGEPVWSNYIETHPDTMDHRRVDKLMTAALDLIKAAGDGTIPHNYQCVYKFEGGSDAEVTIKPGDRLFVAEIWPDGWFYGRCSRFCLFLCGCARLFGSRHRGDFWIGMLRDCLKWVVTCVRPYETVLSRRHLWCGSFCGMICGADTSFTLCPMRRVLDLSRHPQLKLFCCWLGLNTRLGQNLDADESIAGNKGIFPGNYCEEYEADAEVAGAEDNVGVGNHDTIVDGGDDVDGIPDFGAAALHESGGANPFA